MVHLLALVSLIALTVSQSLAQCIPYEDGFNQYNVTLCNLDSTNITPPIIPSPNEWVPTNFDTQLSPIFKLNFSVSIYGVPHSSFTMNNNGAIFFGSTGNSADGSKLPVANTASDNLPILAPWWCDMYYTVGVSTATFGESGPVGRRMFIIRYANFHPYTSRINNPEFQFSFDVIFFEDRPSDIEYRYYRIDLSPMTYKLSIGIQSWNDGGESVVLVTDTADYATWSPLMNRKVLTMRYIGTPMDRERCGGLGYNFESLRGTQLNFTSSVGLTTLVTPCAVVAEPLCRDSPIADKAMICQVTSANVISDLGVFGHGAIMWQYPPDSNLGVEAVLTTGQYCAGIAGSRVTIIAFTCDVSASPTANIADVSNVGGSACVTRIVVRTSLACSGGSRGNDTDLLYTPSTLTSCNRVPGVSYTASLCPRSLSQRRHVTITGALTSVLAGSSTGAVAVDLPLNFWFYGNQYKSLFIALNGALYFGASSSVVPTGPPGFGITVPTTFPAIWAFGASLTNLAYPGFSNSVIMYTNDVQIIDGKQAWVVRFENMKYTAYRGFYDMFVSFDIILFAGQPGGVEIRYYTVSQNSLIPVSIGSHGPDVMDAYTAYTPYLPMTMQLASQLQGATLSYEYTGRSPAEACTAFGVNFAGSFTSDITYTNPNTTMTYYLNPCGPLVSTTPCRNGTSACQVTGTNLATVLSTHNPSSVDWIRSPGSLIGVRATLRDGGWCASIGLPRTVTIDWVCSRLATQATFVQMTEVSTCLFSAIIRSPLACTASVVCNQLKSKYYSGSHCPTLAPVITLVNSRNVFGSLNAVEARIPLGMDFHYYGSVYRYVIVDVFGSFSFGTARNSRPVLMPFATPWALGSLSSVTFSSETTLDSQQVFVVRVRDVKFVGSAGQNNNDTISLDVLLFAGIEGKIEIRYFAMNQPTNLAQVSVGTLNVGFDPEEQLTVERNSTADAALAASFSYSTLRISYSGPDVTTAPCVFGGYNLTSFGAADIMFNDTTSGIMFALRVCGAVSDVECQSEPATSHSSVCAKSYNAVGVTTSVSSCSTYNPAEASWAYPAGLSTGVQLITQASSEYCNATSNFYVTVMNFACVPAATSPAITSVRLIGCTYVVNISSSEVCSAGDRNVPYVRPLSTLKTCVPIPGLLYNGELCPRAATDLYARPEVMTNPVRVLGGRTDNVLEIQLGFNFYLYDHIKTTVSVNTNGLLTFGFQQTNATRPGAFPDISLVADDFPVIAPMFTDLINYDTSDGVLPYVGYISYSYAGVAPSRRVIVRFHRVDYYSARNSIAEQSASFDVVLSEGEPGGIEIRYYRVDPAAAQNVVVGMVGYTGSTSFTAVHNNVPITREVAGQLQGATLKFRYTGIDLPDTCVGTATGFNLSSLSGSDLSYNDTQYQYHIRPCGIVTAAVCTSKYATQRVSVCRASLDGVQTSPLAGDSPALTVLSVTRGTLMATQNNGMTCPQTGLPHRTVIQYICDASVLVPRITAVDASVPCAHTITVTAAVACSNNTFIGTQPEHASGTYNARLWYNPAAVKAVMTNPTIILNATSDLDSGRAVVLSPFPMYIYGEAFSSLVVNVNGWISFRQGTSGSHFTTFPLTGFATALPMIGLGVADLHNSNKAGINGSNTASISWSIEGAAPNRLLLVRWDRVNYYATRSGAVVPDSLLSYDCKIFENSTTIEAQYWQMTSHSSVMAIGIQGVNGNGGPMTVIQSGQTIAARGLFMEDQMVSFVWNGISPIPVTSSSTGVASSSSSAPAITSSASSSAPAPTAGSSSSPIVSNSSSSATPSVPSSSSSSGTNVSSSSAVSSSSSAQQSSTGQASNTSSSTAAPAVSSSTVTPTSSSSSSTTSSSSSIAAPSASSSSSSRTASSSSSSSVAASTGSAELPAGSVKVRFNIELLTNQDINSVIDLLLADIVQTLLRRYGGQASVIRQYLQLSFGSSGASRRLLQQTMTATLTVNGNINNVMTTTDASNIATAVASAIADGSMVAASSSAAVRVPQQAAVVEGGSESESSSSSLSIGVIVAIAVGGTVAVLLLALVVFCFCRQGTSRVGAAHDVEMQRKRQQRKA